MSLNRLRLVYAAVILVLLLAWLPTVAPADFAGFWPARHVLIPLTGALAFGCMAVGVMLAARPVQIEPLLGGLDKFYRLHKWLGVSAALLGIVHWALEVVPRTLVRQGWLTRPPRAGGGQPHLFAEWRGLAGELGEWAFYAMLVLVVIALWKRFPYRYFFKTHRLMAVVYLVLAFHAVVMMPPAYWSAPIGWLLVLLLAGGAAAAVASLFGRIGKSRRAVGTVEYCRLYEGNAVLEVGIQLDTAWPGHKAGQFAFVRFDGREGAHPFTISSAWQNDGRIVFDIKGLGDYTRALPKLVAAGQPVTVEGPYGLFDFRSDRPRQIWIAGGIGITPFLARLRALAAAPESKPVDLIYSTAAPDEAFIANIRRLAEQAGVNFHLLVTPRDGRLDLDRVEQLIPSWREADIWFCGPGGFAQALFEAMRARGLSPRQFHRELFEMR